MYTADDRAAGRGPVIAVIGGGASGTLATIYLLCEAADPGLPLRVALIDRHGRHGLRPGVLHHPSRPPAERTYWHDQGARGRPGPPGPLGGRVRPASGEVSARSAYGRHLTGLLAAAERPALPAARISRITSQVVAIRRGGPGRRLRLHLAADGRRRQRQDLHIRPARGG